MTTAKQMTKMMATYMPATAQEYLNTYAPVYFQGKNFTAQIGFSFGF